MREKARVRSELEKAISAGQPTTSFESELKSLEERIRSIYQAPTWDPIHLAWPMLRAKTAEIKELTSGAHPLSLEGAQRLIEMLYTDIEPRLNCNLQGSTLFHIKNCADRDILSNEVLQYLRDRLLDYYHETKDQCDDANMGPMCEPYAIAFLAQSIASVSAFEDSEAQEAFSHLKSAAVQKCTELQWDLEKGLITELLAMSEDAWKLNNDDVREVYAIVPADLGEEDIRKILRCYQRVLRAPPKRIKEDTILLIDRNLILLASLELSRRNWELWTEVVLSLGFSRSSGAMRDFVAKQKPAKGTSQATALEKVRRVFELHARKM